MNSNNSFLNNLKNTFVNKSVSSISLLCTSLIFIFVLPVFEFQTKFISFLLFSIIIILASYAISGKTTIIGMSVVLINLLTESTDFIYLNYLAGLFSNVFIIFIVGSVIINIMKPQEVTIYTLVDGLNGYLLLAIMFISLVGFCNFYIPGSYNLNGISDMELVYYTLITLTTAGYGDITPELPVAQSLSMLIAVSGQFYVAIIVAVLVGKYAGKLNK